MKILSVIYLYVLLVSCNDHFDEKEVYGYYVPLGYRNTFDTIQLRPDSAYHRKVYDKSHRLVLEMDGRWKFETNHRIILNRFYLNLDDDLAKYTSSAFDTSIEMNSYFETKRGLIQFCVGYYEGENCYQKIR